MTFSFLFFQSVKRPKLTDPRNSENYRQDKYEEIQLCMHQRKIPSKMKTKGRRYFQINNR